MEKPVNFESTGFRPLLVLGGTADGRALAERLHLGGVSVVYSIAGLVRKPEVACRLLVGGFSQFGGLAHYVRQQGVIAILDITHPYAKRMSVMAADTARECAIPYWRFHRQPWRATAGDDWRRFRSWDALLPALEGKQHVLVTTGQVETSTLWQLADGRSKVILRTAVKPGAELPHNVVWLKAIGPFEQEGEQSLLQCHGIDALVSKNSGGDSTVAKLTAARTLGIPVYMLDRPELPAADKLLMNRESCEGFVRASYERMVQQHD